MAVKNGITKAKAMSLVKSSRRRTALVQSKLKPYAPSIGNTLTVVGGGAIAGAVASGATPIPDEIAGLSTPLIIGGVLAGYGIFASGQGQNPFIAKTATNLGQGMIAVWAADYVSDIMNKQQSNEG